MYGIISQNTNKTYLLLTDVPEYVDIENRVFNLQYSEAFSGALYMSEVSLPYVTLEHVLNEVFVSLHYNSCLLTIGMNTVAIMMPFSGVFKVFDSHSRDIFGRPSAMGYCVLISVEGIENLEEYFRLTSRSNVVIPFELKSIMCIHNDDMETELCARVITNSGMVDLPEVFKQCDVNSKILSNTNFDQASKRKIMSNDSTEQSESRATSTKSREYRKTKRTRRQYQSTEQREARLAKMRKYNNSNKAKKQQNDETTEEREARLAKVREYNKSRKAKRQNKTTEEREARLAKKREYYNSRKARGQNETIEQNEARLTKVREYNNFRKAKRLNETTEQREARLAQERERKRASRKQASSQKQVERKGSYSSYPVREGTSNLVSNYFPHENIDELALVRKFHNSVSAGPLYICTCCDQLWY